MVRPTDLAGRIVVLWFEPKGDTTQDGRITLDQWLPSYRRHRRTDEEMPFFLCVD